MKLNGGCMQHTPPRVSTNNNQEQARNDQQMHIFLTNSKKERERDQTRVHQAFTIQEQVKKLPRSAHHLASSIHQEITPNLFFKRERDTKMLKYSENISH
jgi:hypothetical protein